MTNEEKLDQIFPDGICPFSKSWLDCEYKEPNKSENPTGSIIDWNNCHTSEQLSSIATTKNNLGVDCISRTRAIERLKLNFPISQGADNSRDRHRYMQAQADLQAIRELPSVTPQEPILEKINKMKSEIASSLEFWDYSPNNNPLARDILKTITHFWGDMREVEE